MTMIEKVARAISNERTLTEYNWPDFLRESRAAIEAMREPTETMRMTAWAKSGQGELIAYTAMIEAALNEQQL